jgi:hypothetical protein
MTDTSIKEMFDREEVKLTFPRKLDLAANGDSRLLDYVLGSAHVAAKDIQPETMGKIAVAIFYHAKGAYGQISRHCRTKTIDESLLNAEDSELITPHDRVKLPRDLQLKSLFHFKLETKVLDDVGDVIGEHEKESPDEKIGDYIVFTEDGVYRWVYSYARASHLVNLTGMKYHKNLTSKTRFLPTRCLFVKLDSAGFTELFHGKPDLFLNLMHRVKDQLQNEIGELTRIKNVSSGHLENIISMLSKISYH